MNRRAFLGGALAAGALIPFHGVHAVERPDLAQSGLTQLLGRQRVLELGLEYRAMHPWEDHELRLKALIVSRIHQRGGDLSGALERVTRRDFAEGRTVVVNGWVLSVTEARQCALASLLNTRP